MRDQYELRYSIGYPNKDRLFERFIEVAATKLCGGCMTLEAKGMWAEDGAEHSETFSGQITTEHTFHLVLSCERHKVTSVAKSMERVIRSAVRLYFIDTNWVHVQRSEFTGLHFNARETL
jgi:hypothetical protein